MKRLRIQLSVVTLLLGFGIGLQVEHLLGRSQSFRLDTAAQAVKKFGCTNLVWLLFAQKGEYTSMIKFEDGKKNADVLTFKGRIEIIQTDEKATDSNKGHPL